MASSARRGVMSVPACIVKLRRSCSAALSKLRLLFGLENLQLFIKSSDNGLQFIDGGVVFLHQYLLLLIRLFLFVRRQLLGILGGGGVHLELETIQIGVHLAVEPVEVMLRGNHLVLGCGISVGGRVRGAGISARCLCVCGGAKCENQRERYPSLHRESSFIR